MVEQGTYNMVLPYTDRLNYCSAMLNNIGFCKAVETMFGVEVPRALSASARHLASCRASSTIWSVSVPTWLTLVR